MKGGRMGDTTYWLTLAISKKDLAQYMNCDENEIESGEYIGAIRDFAEVVKVEEVED